MQQQQPGEQAEQQFKGVGVQHREVFHCNSTSLWRRGIWIPESSAAPGIRLDLKGLSCSIPTLLFTVNQKTFQRFLHNNVCALNRHLDLARAGKWIWMQMLLAAGIHHAKGGESGFTDRYSANISNMLQFSQ